MSIEVAAESTLYHAEAVSGTHIFMSFFVLFLFIFLYNLPWIIALKRKHPDTLSVFILDFFLGWSVIGWIIALIWACKSQQNQAPINVTVVNSDKN